MPKVRCFTLDGIECWFWSHDHSPPHFHAKRKGEWEVRVYFLLEGARMVDIVWQVSQMSAKDLKKLRSRAMTHRDQLLKEWEGTNNATK